MIPLIRLAIVLACAVLVIPTAPTAVRAIGAIPLIFVFPGYALALNVIPRSADVVTRTAWTIGLSLAASALLPIVIGIAGIALSPRVWVVGLVTVTVVGELGAHLRRSAPALPRPHARLSARSAAVLAIAGAITVGGVILSLVDADRRAVTTATQLWMVPSAADELRIGVMPYGAAAEPLRLVIDDGSTRQEFPISTAGGTFETTWPLSSGVAVVRATLYAGDSVSPLREVFHRNDP